MIDEQDTGASQAEAAHRLLLVAQRRTISDQARIRTLESAIQEMCGNIRGLASQGEDYIWRPVQRALNIADAAIAPDPARRETPNR